MATRLRKLARAFDRLARNDKTYYLRLDFSREPKPPAGVSVREDGIMGTFVISASGGKGEILGILGAVGAMKNPGPVRGLIRDSEDSLYLGLLPDGRIVVDREENPSHPGSGPTQ